MNIELRKQYFNNTHGFKIIKKEYCCEKLKKCPVICLSDEVPVDGYENNDNTIPSMMIYESKEFTDYDNSWEEEFFYPISVCPFCGETIDIKVTEEVDISDEFKKAIAKRNELQKKRQKTDSRKEYHELLSKVQELDSQIDGYYGITEAKE